MKSSSLLHRLISAVFLFTLFLVFTDCVYATSGCCSWHGGVSYCDSSVGRYVCSDGSYSPSCGCYYSPAVYIPPTPRAPAIQASFTYNPNPDGKTFNVVMSWNNVTNTGFSVALHKLAGGNPGPLVDTYTNSWVFYNVLPGKYYADMKVGINYVWSNIVYWEVNVPKWYSPAPQKTVTSTNETITKTTPISSAVSSAILPILIGLTIVVGVVFAIYKGLVWFIQYVRNNDWVYTVLFWGIVIVVVTSIGTSSSNKSSKTYNSVTQKSGYSCNCSKTCPNMSCSEAYFQLNTCGCNQRDGDGDGVPCEAQCK